MQDHTPETHQADPYDVVLADLRAQRDRIDNAIDALTALRGTADRKAPPTSPAVGSIAGNGDSSGGMSEGQFLGMSIADATVKLLSIRKKKMNNAEILADLKSGGLVLTSKEPGNVVNSVLSRRFASAGDIVRVERGYWGLKTWYPGRNFNKVKVASPDKTASDLSDMLDEPMDVEDDPGESDVANTLV